jgi:spore germination protein YaaH
MPAAGHEVYGFVPYWEMDDGIAAHLRRTALTTVGLFSITSTGDGAIARNLTGYRKIAGSLGKQLIREAHGRGVRVELVFTSFGYARNKRFFSDLDRQDKTIAALVRLTRKLRADGIAVDVELLDATLVPAYGAFVGRLRAAVVAADSSDRVTVATWGSITGAMMAAAAASADVDRVFLMGYDYHWADTVPGASAPVHRRDDNGGDLVRTLDRYEAFGVPVERTLLGLPLYGMSWPVAEPTIGAPSTGSGEPWILRHHLDVLRSRSIVPEREDVEVVEFYALPAGKRRWRAVYVDSPKTLAAKLAMANERGFAGAGFWAIGYERGLPAYTKLIARFAAGKPMK